MDNTAAAMLLQQAMTSIAKSRAMPNTQTYIQQAMPSITARLHEFDRNILRKIPQQTKSFVLGRLYWLLLQMHFKTMANNQKLELFAMMEKYIKQDKENS